MISNKDYETEKLYTDLIVYADDCYMSGDCIILEKHKKKNNKVKKVTKYSYPNTPKNMAIVKKVYGKITTKSNS